ncbi:MAG: M43 family zinc metalloprotease [Bacteroidota bacterium]
MQKIFSVLFIFSCFPALAQTENRCGFLHAQEYLFSQDPAARQRTKELMEAAEEPEGGWGQGQAKTTSVSNYTIPVVFHVLHQGGPENISDAQIIDEIAILNRDYTKQNPDTINAVAPFQNLIGNCGVEFRLATIDPNGNCTNGITRHFDANTDWTVNFANYIYTWDRTKYLNIYVVKTMPAGSAAYSFYPGQVGPSADGVVVQSIYVGSIGTSQPFVSRIVTHEVGHWLNLQHLWGSTNQPGFACGNDGVNDTPVTKGFTTCNLNNAIVCSAGITENMQNYMDYAYCQVMFTPGQCVRMQAALNSGIAGRNNLSSTANLLATGVTNPLYNCAPKAQFKFNNATSCLGNSVGFTDLSYNAPITSWQWSSPQASNISTQQNGVLNFISSGLVTVKLKVSNAFGSDSVVQQKMLVLPAAGTGSTNINQGFETISFPDNLWMASLPLTGAGFQQINSASLNGFNSVWVDNYNNPPGEKVSFYTPAFDLQTTVSSTLTFYYAYTQQGAGDNDRLRVYGSDDCGSTWLTMFTKSGAALNSTQGLLGTSYDQPSQEEWREENINTDYYFAGKPRVYFKFEFTRDSVNQGNNLFIDDINLRGLITTGISAGLASFAEIKVAPNPFSGCFTLSGNAVEKISTLHFFDVSGRLLKTLEVAEGKRSHLELKGLQDLSAGVYFVRLSSAEGSRVLKLVKE